MTARASRDLIPCVAIPPGELLRDELEARGWSQIDFAAITGRPHQTINEIVSGKKAITIETAVAFSSALGTTPQYWLNLENAYRLALAQRDKPVNEEIRRRACIYSKAPVNELLRSHWIRVKNPKSNVELERAVCEFLEIGSIDQEPCFELAARRSGDDPWNASHMAWFFRAKHMARQESVKPYSKQHLKDNLKTIRNLCESVEATRQVKKVLAGLGVRFVVVEHLPKTKIDGGSLWLDERSPVVALSLRYDRLDYFWFTLMHELSHILNEDSKPGKPRIDEQLCGSEAKSDQQASKIEERANRDAAGWLIDPRELDVLIQQHGTYVSAREIRAFACKARVHPSIVVGQLQHRKIVPWTHFRGMSAKIRNEVMG